jgi:5,10-methylenetetrahydrofolate reductase
VDVYDTSTDKWDKLELSEARMEGAAAGINNILLIGGGFTEFGGFSKAVDIFTLSK